LSVLPFHVFSSRFKISQFFSFTICCFIVYGLDFSKAFDTVRHSTLLQKIALLDLPDFVYNWLVDFFEGRSHCTAHNDLVSEVAHILASIIQGSVIGPASYVVNASDLRTVKPENDLVKYADDTDLIVAEEHVETRFEELNNISTWADVNNLKLNKAKSVEIVFRRPRSKKAVPPPPIPGIARVEEFSFLGVTFRNNFSEETHVNDIIGSCARTLYALRILRAHGMNNEAIHSVFKSTVLARLLYASPAWWGFTSASQRDRLEAFIRKSIRLGFCSENIGSFQSMCEASDKQFFDAIKNNPSHILNHLLQSKPSSGYELRPREYNYVLPDNSTRLADCNFINRILYRKIF